MTAFVAANQRQLYSANGLKLHVLAEAFRVGVLVVILFSTVLLQSIQAYFVNLSVLLPIYSVLFISYVMHGFYISNFERLSQKRSVQAALFFFDVTLIACLVLFTNLSHTLFIFLFFIHITLCGMVFRRRGAFILASWVSVLYSLILVLNQDSEGQGLILSLTLNNFAFFCTAYLSGILSEQLNLMGLQLTKRTEGLRAVQDLNKVVVEEVGSGIITVDKSGAVEQCNESFAQIIGAESSDILGESASRLLPISDSIFSDSYWLNESGGSRRLEVEIKNLKGSVVILDVVISPIIRSKQVLGFILILHDVTQIRKLEAGVRQSEKLAAVGQLAAGIAHEIRNPLASISGSIQMLETMSDTEEERGRLMKIVLREIDRLNGLITEFLEYVRPENQTTKVMNLSSLVSETLEMVKLNDKLRSDVKQSREIEATLKIKGDENKLKQALLNFTINAYQAMEKVEDPELRVSLTRQGNKALLIVRDNGCGMDAENAKKMFEPFHTTKPKGTGLGLAITHKILEIHKADIDVRSEIGIGTEITLKFPIISALEESQNKSEDNNTNSIERSGS